MKTAAVPSVRAVPMIVPGRPTAVPSQYRRRLAPEVYTVAEVADLLGLALGGAYELVRDGTIPARKLGGRWVIPKNRFHAWLDSEDQGDEPDAVSATRDRDRTGGRR
ncbi:helix-turn-helix domain-containing protein [Catellatospora paridis]|uniref:helix-turn-helix domain-containing protein n=1 Tax=Catellatospora paridis TaxID=1617086 RepID=UPI001E48E0F3|nr:helix-turn-helix domain-containing protein [Catellatospora paridis]